MMTIELISVLMAVLAIGLGLAGLILAGWRGVRHEMRDMRQDMRDIRHEIRDMRTHIGRIDSHIAELRERSICPCREQLPIAHWRGDC